MNGHFIGADRAHIVAAHLNAGGNGIAAAVCGNVGKIGDHAHLAAVDGVKVARRAAQRDGQRRGHNADAVFTGEVFVAEMRCLDVF